MEKGTGLMRAKVVKFNGSWGFLESPYRDKWKGRDIFFHLNGGRFPSSSGIRKRFSKINPENPFELLPSPKVGDMVVFHPQVTDRGARADVWCPASIWDAAEAHYYTGRITRIDTAGGYAIVLASDQHTSALVHRDNWRPVQTAGQTAYLEYRLSDLLLRSAYLPKVGDTIVFQIVGGQSGLRARPWTFEEDWADAWYGISQT